MVGERVRQARDRRAMTQDELAKASGVSVPALNRIENTKGQPRAATIRKLADALGVRVVWLSVGDEPAEEPEPEDEVTFYARTSREMTERSRQIVATLKELEAADGLLEKERAKATRAREQHEKSLRKLEAADRRVQAVYVRRFGRPFADEPREDEGR